MPRTRKTRLILSILTITLLTVIATVGWLAYGLLGKTPGELIDYAEWRLQGHTKLEWVALPVLAQARVLLDEPIRPTKLQIPFNGPLQAIIPPVADPEPDLPALPGFSGRTLRVGPQQTFRTIAAAAAAARSGDSVEIDAGDYVADVAVWRQHYLTIRGRGGKVRLIAAGASAEGKAIWVIGGKEITVENIIFTGAKVSDQNGAGIRFEHGKLIVRKCAFLNNENGILTSNDPKAELVIENSEFGFGGGQSHNLYVGHIKKLTVTGSYFHHASVKHLLKSRAGESFIFYNRLTDEIGGIASYELEFPNGGLAYVMGNIIEQSSTTQNPIIISYGAEGYKWPKNELYLTYNTIVDDYPKGGTFLRYKNGLDKLFAANNVLVGQGTLTGGIRRWATDWVARLVTGKQAPAPITTKIADIQIDHNITTGWESFAQASRFDYRVKDGELTAFKPVRLSPANGVVLEPSREYVHPLTTRALATVPLLPGAVQGRPDSLP